jgi:hypothetical protein
MSQRRIERPPDADVLTILDGLEAYRASHPLAKIKAYRQNSGSIRIRIIDPDFAPLDKALRHDHVWALLRQLDDDVISQITVVLLLTPKETKTSFANMDFNNAIPSDL